ncbi:DUF3089-containing protein [Aureococcus anophagefferens]|nr:DUF3089-containing protein [Aureococcus anophagefferens]
MMRSAAVQDCLAVAAAGALIGFYLGYRRRARRDAADASEQEQQPDYGDPDAWAGSSEPRGEAAFDVAFADVAAALELFLTKHRRPGRPWILAGHSQGAGHVTRWLNERSARFPAEMADLVVALPLGIQHGADSLPPGLRFAGGPRDFGVVLV